MWIHFHIKPHSSLNLSASFRSFSGLRCFHHRLYASALFSVPWKRSCSDVRCPRSLSPPSSRLQLSRSASARQHHLASRLSAMLPTSRPVAYHAVILSAVSKQRSGSASSLQPSHHAVACVFGPSCRPCGCHTVEGGDTGAPTPPPLSAPGPEHQRGRSAGLAPLWPSTGVR